MKIPVSESLRWAGIAIWLAALFPFHLEAQQKGHALSGNQILINSSSHWRAWDVAGGIAEITTDGSIGPRFIRKNVNAAQDAAQFSFTSQGGATAGSRPGEAANLIDGDPNTTWGPDPDSPLKDWWATVDLGRVAVSSKIVVRFAEVGEGDPFLQFKVLVWRHGPSGQWRYDYTLKGTDIPNFWEIGRTIRPNKTERVFEFVPPSTEGTNALFEGDPVEMVQVVAIDSDFDRAQEVTKEDYDNLPEDKKGTVDYYRRGLSGREILASKQEYDEFDSTRKGSIKYYRKEIPRLAEIEVWTDGDNINLGASERGGFLTVDTNAGPKNLGSSVTDGDYTTGHNGSIFGKFVYEFFEDLGALFWIDSMHFILDGASPIDELFVDISDGTRAPDGSIKWTRVVSSVIGGGGSHTSSRGPRYREFQIDPAQVRFIRTPFQSPTSSLSYIGFTEVMLYGQGFVPEVELTSDLIQLEGNKNLISIEWEADIPPGTRVEVQTRTGNELSEEKVFHDSKGNVVTEKRYNKLPKSKKGEITSFLEASPDWAPWSTAYAVSGDPIKSPSPREYMLVRARLLSEDPDMTARLRSITVNMSDPLADRVFGEVSPNRIQAIGQAEDFSFFIRPVFSSSRQRFDQIMIEASSGTSMELLEVRAGSADDFAGGQPEVFSRDRLEVLADGGDTLWVQLPEAVGQGMELVEVEFRPVIFSNSASFRASVQNSASPGFWQRVDAGDATELVDSQVTTVLALGGNSVISEVRMASEVMTPNGDGINDELIFNFGVARVNAAKAVKLTIYDLSGALVAEVAEQRLDPRGNYALAWPGKDPSGQVVPPGIYLARIEVDVDSESASSTSVDRVVYVAY